VSGASDTDVASGRRLSPSRSVGWTTALAIALGAALRWPALLAPFHSDDYQQLAMLRGAFVLKRPAWDLFWFGPRTMPELGRLIAFGFDPWWTSPNHRLSMLRPLSSLLIWLDDRSFGASPLPWHLHSLLWWAALIGGVGLLLHKLLPSTAAALALLIFALDEAHDVPLAWLANRSTLVAASFGVLGLCAHLHFRTTAAGTARRRYAALSALCFALSLAGGEYAFGTLAYLLAFEALGARDAWSSRLRALLPATLLAGLYLALRTTLGYGVGGSGLYVDPSDPLGYLERVAIHVPVLAANLVLGVPTQWWDTGSPLRDFVLEHELLTPALWQRSPSWHSAHLVLGLGALLGAALALRWLARRAPAEASPLAWLLAGSLLSLIAAAGTGPSERLLGAPALGVSALLASLLLQGARTLGRRELALGTRLACPGALLCAAIVIVHIGLAARRAYAETAAMRGAAEASESWAVRAEIPDNPRALDVVIVSASDFATAANLPWLRLMHGLPLPHSYRRLSGAMQAHDLRRTGERSLELEVLASDLGDAFAGSIYRPRSEGFVPGQRMRLPGMEIEVLAVQEGNPWRLRFVFDRALDDPHLVFLHARPGGLRRFTPPAVGATLRLPRAALPWDAPLP
jgi:hypothetical protein